MKMLSGQVSRIGATGLLAAMLLVLALIGGHDVRRTGGLVQVALPAMGLGCAGIQGQAVAYLGRYLVLEAGIKVPKIELGDRPFSRRPDGGDGGFPSGHTAAASFGAAGLMRTCLASSPFGQFLAVMAAGFTGGSRIEARRHTLWQVLAGAVWGWVVQIIAVQRIMQVFRLLWRVRFVQ